MSKPVEETAVQIEMQFVNRMMTLEGHISVGKFCMKRCDMAKDFSTDQISEQETECLGKLNSFVRQ